MKKENDFIQDIKTHLDQSTDSLAPKTLSKIRSARYDALHPKKNNWISFGLPLSGFAAAVIAVYAAVTFFTAPDMKSNMKPESRPVEVVKALPPEEQMNEDRQTDMKIVKTVPSEQPGYDIIPSKESVVRIQAGQIELVDILTAGPKLEFFENLEFYTWLAENPEENLDS